MKKRKPYEVSGPPNPKRHNADNEEDNEGDGDFDEEMAMLEQMEAEMIETPEFLGEGNQNCL